ncbi:MAG: tape measure protein [Alkalispirochaeta sp.]
MNDIASLTIEVQSKQVDQANRSLGNLTRSGRDAERSTGQLTNQTRNLDNQSGSLSRNLGGVIAKYVGLGAAVITMKKLASAGMDAAAAVERQSVSLGVLLGDVELGTQLFSDLQEFSSKTPLAVQDLSNAAQMLMSFGVEADDVTDTLQTLGDASLGNSQKLESLSRAYGRVLARGKASMEEINIAMESGVPIIETLAEEMGVTESAVFDLASQGAITAAVFQDAFKTMTSEGGQFAGGMEALSETFDGKVSTAMDNIRLLGADMFAPAIDGAKDLLDGVIDVSRQLRRLYQTSSEQRNARVETFIAATADEIRSAASYEEIAGEIRGLSEEMYDAAVATRNFEDAARQARTAAVLEEDIRRLQEGMSETVGPINEVREAVERLFSKEIKNDSEDWWENFTVQDRTNQIARLLDDININGADLLNTSDAQSLAQAGEAAIVGWLDRQIEYMGGQSDELEALQRELSQILSGEGITEVSTSGGGGDDIAEMVKDRTKAYDEYEKTLERVELLSEVGWLDQEEQIEAVIAANESYIQSLADLDQAVLEAQDSLGLREMEDAVDRVEALQFGLQSLRSAMGTFQNYADMFGRADLSGGGGPTKNPSDQIDKSKVGIDKEAAESLKFYQLNAEEAEVAQQALNNAMMDGAMMVGDAYLSTLQDIGAAMAGMGNSGQALEDGLWNLLDTFINALPRLLFMAGVYIIAGSGGTAWPIGLALIAASGLAAVGAGYWNANNADRREELEARASGGPVSPNTPYLVGERGPELMVPRSSGSIVPNGSLGGGGGNVNVQVINQAPGVRVEPQQERTGPNGERQIKMMVKQISKEAFARGEMDDVMGTRYGVQNRGVSRS